MDKRNIIAAVVVGLALIGGLVVYQTRSTKTVVTQEPQPTQKIEPTKETPPVPKAAAVITEVSGDAFVSRDGSTSVAAVKMELKEGDEVQVDAGSMTITYPDYGRTLVASSTRFVVRKAERKEADDSLVVNVKLQAGRVWSRFEKLFGPKDSFDVRAGSVVSTVRGTSFGVQLDGPKVNVQVAEHTVAIHEVQDREPTEEEQARGISDLELEAPTGLESSVHANEEVRIDPVAGTSMEAMFQPHALPAEVLQDPFVQQANEVISAEDLHVQQIDLRGFDKFDMSVYMQWIQDMTQRYPNGDVPLEEIGRFYRSMGIPVTDEMLRNGGDEAAMEAYFKQMGIVAPTKE